MFRRSLPQTEQNSRKRRQAEERDSFQAEQRIGSDQSLAPKGRRNTEEFGEIGRRQLGRNDRKHEGGAANFSAWLPKPHDQFGGKCNEQKSKADLEQNSWISEQPQEMRPRPRIAR
jgi:hypothetical protein